MRDNNITNAEELSIIFRQRQKKMWREKISKTKKAIYWSNEDVDLPYEDDDVIQWWGYTRNIDQIRGNNTDT
jgi:hexosaminidase